MLVDITDAAEGPNDVPVAETNLVWVEFKCIVTRLPPEIVELATPDPGML